MGMIRQVNRRRSSWIVKDNRHGCPWYVKGIEMELGEGAIRVLGTGARSQAARYVTRREADKVVDAVMFGRLFGGDAKVRCLYPIGILKVEEVCE